MSIALKIRLSRGKFSLIDSEDFKKVSRFKWHCVDSRGKLYAVRNITIDRYQKKRRLLQMHRFVLGLYLKGTTSVEVDHINGNSLDNRKSNLRICYQHENKANRRDLDSSAGVYRRNGNRYSSAIWHLCKKISLGSFRSKNEAHDAYVLASRKLKGEFSPYAI